MVGDTVEPMYTQHQRNMAKSRRMKEQETAGHAVETEASRGKREISCASRRPARPVAEQVPVVARVRGGQAHPPLRVVQRLLQPARHGRLVRHRPLRGQAREGRQAAARRLPHGLRNRSGVRAATTRAAAAGVSAMQLPRSMRRSSSAATRARSPKAGPRRRPGLGRRIPCGCNSQSARSCWTSASGETHMIFSMAFCSSDG